MTREPARDGILGERTTFDDGQAWIVSRQFARRAHQTDDPRNVFYKAMLQHDTYEDYLEQVGKVTVVAPTYKRAAISGHAEIIYARHHGWIVDSLDTP